MDTTKMKVALEEAYEGIHQAHGGPFGAVVVKDGKIVGRGHNCVLKNADPTAHGEIVAIRDACQHLQTHDLSGCELYTTAEPCPMCLGAILWAGIHHIYYGCNRLDTDKIGFRDQIFYDVLEEKQNLVTLIPCEREECLKLFSEYERSEKRQLY